MLSPRLEFVNLPGGYWDEVTIWHYGTDHWRSFDLRMVQCWWSVAATSWDHRLRRRSIGLASNITEETVCEPTAYGGYDLQDVECQDMVPASSSSATAPPVHRLSTAPARLEALPLDMQETMNKMVRSWAAIATLTVSVDEEGPHGWQSQGWEVDPRPLARQDLLNLADLMYLVRQQLRDNLPPRLLEVAMDRLRQLVRAPTPGLSPLAEELLDPPTPPVPGPNPYLTLFQQSDSASDSLEEVQIDEADEAATLLAITEDAIEAPHEAEAVDVVVESEAEQLRSVARASCITVGAGVAYANRILEDRARRTAAKTENSHGRGPPSQVTMVDAATAPAEAGPTAVGADAQHDVTRERACVETQAEPTLRTAAPTTASR